MEKRPVPNICKYIFAALLALEASHEPTVCSFWTGKTFPKCNFQFYVYRVEIKAHYCFLGS